SASGGILKREIYGLIGFHQSVVDDGNKEGLDGFTRPKAERSVGRHIVQTGRGRAVTRGIVHIDRGICVSGSLDRDGGISSVLVHTEVGGGELDRAVVV